MRALNFPAYTYIVYHMILDIRLGQHAVATRMYQSPHCSAFSVSLFGEIEHPTWLLFYCIPTP